jgi:hypothetical protein
VPPCAFHHQHDLLSPATSQHHRRTAAGHLGPLTHPLHVAACLQVMQMCSVWVLMVAFPTPLGLPYEGAFVEGVPELSWAANNSAKLGAGGGGLECWTIISSREFGAQHKVRHSAAGAAGAQQAGSLRPLCVTPWNKPLAALSPCACTAHLAAVCLL